MCGIPSVRFKKKRAQSEPTFGGEWYGASFASIRQIVKFAFKVVDASR